MCSASPAVLRGRKGERMGMRTTLGVFVIVVAAIMAVFLGGCGGSVKGDNSGYRGAYADVPHQNFFVNSRSELDGSLTFTISEKGNMVGSLLPVDKNGVQTGPPAIIEGFFQNNGDFGASLIWNGTTYHIDGKFSRQQVPAKDVNDPTKTVMETGLAGNFRITIDGVIYDGVFGVPGGVVTQ